MRTSTKYQSSPTAYAKITVTVDGDTHATEGTGNERLVGLTTDEQAFGSVYIVELDNSDNALNAKNYEGYPITLNLSFDGETTDDFPPLWVHHQRLISKEGKLLLQLICVDIWVLIDAIETTYTGAQFNQHWQNATYLDELLMPDGVTLVKDVPALYADLLANGDKTIWEILQYLANLANFDLTFVDTDSYITTLKSPLKISNIRSGIKQALDFTECYLKVRASDGHLISYNPTLHGTVYSFNTLDLFYSNVHEAAVTIPNKVIVWSYNDAGDAWISGQDTDSASYTKLGRYIDRHHYIASMDIKNTRTEAELNQMAAGILAKLQAEKAQGMFVAPMHVSLELFDAVSVVDSRYSPSKTITGYVHRMQREYDRGKYQITVYLGGVTGGYTPPEGTPVKGFPDADPLPTPPVVFPEGELTIGAYIADIAFTSVDWNTVSWTAGLVTLADGRSQSVIANPGYDFLTADPHYFYVILGNNEMQVSTTATDAVGNDRMLVAVGARGSSTAVKAYILNPYTDDILINTDKVMDGLVTELKLASEAVTNAKIKVGAIYGDVIAAAAITETKISNNAISTPKLAAGSVIASKIGAGEVVTDKLAALNVTSDKIAAGAITTNKISAGAVTAIKIDVTNLSAISANCGTLTSGVINGVTIYAGGGNVKLDSTGAHFYGRGESNSVARFYSGTTRKGSIYAEAYGTGLQVGANGILHLAATGEINMHATYVRMDNTKYLELPRQSTNPSANNGSIYYNTSDGTFRARYAGKWYYISLGAEAT